MLEAGRSRLGSAGRRALPGDRKAASASSISASQSAGGLGGIRGSVNRHPFVTAAAIAYFTDRLAQKVLTLPNGGVKV
jgi:hypothetical protein